jgi:hypothetical protein
LGSVALYAPEVKTLQRSAAWLAHRPSFTQAGTSLAGYANGALMRSEAIEGAPNGAAAYRVLYRSEGGRADAGRIVLVSVEK